MFHVKKSSGVDNRIVTRLVTLGAVSVTPMVEEDGGDTKGSKGIPVGGVGAELDEPTSN